MAVSLMEHGRETSLGFESIDEGSSSDLTLS